MKTVTSLSYCADSPSVVALGCFDGVHLGHAAVIGTARRMADELVCPLTVWTFDEPPKNFFAPGSVPLLTDRQIKCNQIAALGADTFVCVRFTEAVGNLSPEDFFEDILLRKLCAKHLVCGFNYHFGARAKGDTSLLELLCQRHGVGLTILPPTCLSGEPISSSRIRAAIQDGDMEAAARMLGRPYAICEVVIDGQHLGRKLGFPTINQLFPTMLAIPRYGVYMSRVSFNDRTAYGITNVGIRPTVNGTILCAETHILDFEGDLYGKEVCVEFLQFLRPERRFSSVEALSEQVHKDIQSVRDTIKK